LRLPNRWFGGRYGENQHEVTFLAERPRKLLIELDERQLLTFTGIPTVEDRLGDGRRELVLRDFLQLTFDWEEYGGRREDARVAVHGRRGDVRLATRVLAPPVGWTMSSGDAGNASRRVCRARPEGIARLGRHSRESVGYEPACWLTSSVMVRVGPSTSARQLSPVPTESDATTRHS
jgi:hypothetical protein